MGTIMHGGVAYSGLGTPNTWGEITGTLSQQTDLQNVLDTKYERASADILGAKNLLPHTNNVTDSVVINGVTWTVNSDGSVTANGTASGGNSLFRLINGYIPNFTKGRILSTGITDAITGIFISILYSSNGTSYSAEYDLAFGEAAVPSSYDTYGYANCALVVSDGKTANNVTFKPMLRLASDPDDTFEPYTMTNRELTMREQTVTRLVSSASAGAQIRIPESGTDSRISASARSIIKPVCELTNNRETRCSSFTVGEGYGTITVGEAISNKNIGFRIIKI